MDEGFLAFVAHVLASAAIVYNQLVARYAADKLREALSEGGEIFEMLMSAAIAGAEIWYGMYTPTRYKRGYTMSNRGNIAISATVNVSGTSISAECVTANVSPHAGFSEGFWFYKRGKPFWRPGGDLMALVPGSISYSIDVPQDTADQCFTQAMAAVLG